MNSAVNYKIFTLNNTFSFLYHRPYIKRQLNICYAFLNKLCFTAVSANNTYDILLPGTASGQIVDLPCDSWGMGP